MAIILQPNFNTSISPSVGTPNVIDEKEGLPYERLGEAGKVLQQAGQALYQNARAQARSGQLREAQEAYRMRVTQDSLNAASGLDTNTGKIGKGPTAPMFSDYMIQKADMHEGEVAKEIVEPEFHEDFKNSIADLKSRTKTESLVTQAQILTKTSEGRLLDGLSRARADFSLYNGENKNIVDEAIRVSMTYSKNIIEERNAGNIHHEKFREIGIRAKTEFAETTMIPIILKQAPQDLVDAIGYDFFQTGENMARYKEEKAKGTAWAVGYGELLVTANKAAQDPKADFKRNQVDSYLFYSADQKQRMLSQYLTTMEQNNRATKEGFANTIGDVVTTYENPLRTRKDVAKAEKTLGTLVANAKQSGMRPDEVLNIEIQAKIAYALGSGLRNQPFMTPSQRDVAAARATDAALNSFKNNPEYSAFIKGSPSFGATVKANAMAFLEKQDSALRTLFNKDPASFVYAYNEGVQGAWQKAFSSKGTKQDMENAKVLTSNQWMRYSEGAPVRLDDMKYKIIPDSIFNVADTELENALAEGNYDKVKSLYEEYDKKGVTSQIAYKAVKNNTPTSGLQQIVQYLNPELAAQFASLWQGREERAKAIEMEFDKDDNTDYKKALNSFVLNNSGKLAIPGQEGQAVKHMKNIQEIVEATYTQKLLSNRGPDNNKPIVFDEEAFKATAREVFSKISTSVNIAGELPKRLPDDPRKPSVLRPRQPFINGELPSKFVPAHRVKEAEESIRKYDAQFMADGYKDLEITDGTVAGKLFNDMIVQRGMTNLPIDQKIKAFINYYKEKGSFRYVPDLATGTLRPALYINGTDKVPLTFRKEKSYLKMQNLVPGLTDGK